MKRKLIYFIALIFLMIITALNLGTWFAIIRSINDFSFEEYISISKVIINNTSPSLWILFPLCIFMELLCLWFYRYKRSTGFYMGLTSLFLIILTLLMTWLVLGPVNKNIMQWSLNSIPANWESIRNKWQLFYGLCTLFFLLSYGCFSWFILAAMRKNKLANY